MTWRNDLREFAPSIKGLRKEEGRALVLDRGGLFCVTWEDGRYFATTADIRSDRVKVKVEDDVIIYVTCG